MGTKSKQKQKGSFGGGQGFHELHTFNEITEESEYNVVKIKHREDYTVLLHQRKMRGQV